ncbi:MAG: indolepyruvate oxidoreductase subunit beta [Clostridiales bacterium]|nr:indolepyruvate oxidoreductase subunit beta [Clostridiales bacterium]
MKELSIAIVGVGGQGTLLTSRILGALAMGEQLDVKVSEVHGMAQRCGSVVTFMRIGERVFAPLVDDGCADYVLAFEQIEAARAVRYLKVDGAMILSDQAIPPMPVLTGAAQYPEALIARIGEGRSVVALNALAMAEAAGEPRAVNMVLLGVLARRADFPRAAWEAAIAACVPERLLAVNLKAFDMGYAIA